MNVKTKTFDAQEFDRRKFDKQPCSNLHVKKNTCKILNYIDEFRIITRNNRQ